MTKRPIGDKHCPDCGKVGQVVTASADGSKLKVQCTCNKKQWWTASGTCPDCGRPNSFPGDGLCLQCYSKYQLKKGA